MEVPSLEERVTVLEAELKQLKQQSEPEKAASAPRGWQRIVGIFKDDPEFEEAVRLGREWRMADALNDNEDIP